MSAETAITFECAGVRLVSILHAGKRESSVGIVFVVGGPQYRVGSHRQFVLMARSLAEAGYPVLRFDYRGMGDSEGEPRSFDAIDEDLRSAVDRLCSEVPTLERVILLGLCDAASAIMIYAAKDDRVRGLILLNPWVRSEQGEAKAYLKHYYLQRLLQASFWRKVFRGEFAMVRSIRDFTSSIWQSLTGKKVLQAADLQSPGGFVARMLSGFQRYKYAALIQISGRDLTAKEFVDLCDADLDWRHCVDRSTVEIQEFPDADHTMSSRRALDNATAGSIDWIREHIPSIS